MPLTRYVFWKSESSASGRGLLLLNLRTLTVRRKHRKNISNKLKPLVMVWTLEARSAKKTRFSVFLSN